jgi:hypothetical protein
MVKFIQAFLSEIFVMSFQVYNAFRFPQSMTVDDVFTWIDPLRVAVRIATEKAFHKALVRDAICVYDRVFLAQLGDPALVGDTEADSFGGNHAAVSSNNLSSPPIHVARGFLLDELGADQRSRRRNRLNPETTLTVFRNNDGRLYGIVHSESRAAIRVISSAPGLVDFSYSDAGDCPDDISEDDWDARGELWDELLGSRSVPAHRGAVFQLASPDHLVMGPLPTEEQVDRILKDLPSDHHRESRVFPRTLESMGWIQYEKNSGIVLTRPSEFMNRLDALHKGKDEHFNALLNQVGSVLPLSFSAAVLLKDPCIPASPVVVSSRRP